jgi:hypothetical protein
VLLELAAEGEPLAARDEVDHDEIWRLSCTSRPCCIGCGHQGRKVPFIAEYPPQETCANLVVHRYEDSGGYHNYSRVQDQGREVSRNTA